MKASVLLVVMILIVTLFAVAVSAEQAQTTRTDEYRNMAAQRDQAVRLAIAAKEQRDGAYLETNQQKSRVGDLENGLQKTTDEKNALAGKLDQANKVAGERQSQIVMMQGQIKVLEAENTNLRASNQQLQANVRAAKDNMIPPSGGSSAPAAAAAPAKDGRIMLLSLAGGKKVQLMVGLAVLFGMVMLSSGGYVAYRSDANRKVSVKMTPDQIKEFARYQRERGRNAG